MGLDQYAWAVPDTEVMGLPDADATLPEAKEMFFQWRKHADLQGWMEALWRKRGGEGEFNCKTLRLSLSDLEQLERDVRNNALPETEGFFFGESTEDDMQDTLKFVDQARMRITKDNQAIFYDSWW